MSDNQQHNGHGNGHVNGINRDLWMRFRFAVRTFLKSSSGRVAFLLLGLLVFFLVAINALNVVNSYVGRDFITAIENRDKGQFNRQAWLYLGVFALSTLVAVFYRFVEERLALLWREWQTKNLLNLYLGDRVYYQIETSQALENPDQRISEDIRTFTTTTLSFVLMTLNATFTIVAFSGVLWSIRPQLFVVAVVYAMVGTALTVLLGKRLVGLNHQQLDKEANFRSELIHVRENAESLALLHREDRQKNRLRQRLDELVANSKRMIAVSRNLSFFTTGYNYMIQIMPALIVAPLFIRGDVQFGVITQSAMAFAALMGAFSLIVTQFQAISSYAAVLRRLARLGDVVEHACTPKQAPVTVEERPGSLSYDHLTLESANGNLLVKDLNLTIPPGNRVLVTGDSGFAKAALFKATAGLCCQGSGRILRPGAQEMMFLPERPYLSKGTLREILQAEAADTASASNAASDEKIWQLIAELGLKSVVEQAGGLDQERDWNEALGLQDQALIAVARVVLASPQFVFMDRLSVTMDAAKAHHVLEMFRKQNIAYLVLGRPGDEGDLYDATLHLSLDGSWKCRPQSKANG